jgi:hypothetical protein
MSRFSLNLSGLGILIPRVLTGSISARTWNDLE